MPRPNSVSGGRALSRADDRAEGGPASGFDRKDLRLAALHRSAEVDRVGTPREGRLRRNGSGLLLDGEGFAGQARFVDQEVRGLDQEPIGRNEVACREHDDIAGHDGARRDSLLDAIAYHTAGQRQTALEFFDRGRCPVLLIETEQRAAEHDRQNDACVHPFPQCQRNCRAEDENEDERAFELPQQQAQGAQPARVLDAVGANSAKLLGGIFGRQAPRARAQSALSSATSRLQYGISVPGSAIRHYFRSSIALSRTIGCSAPNGRLPYSARVLRSFKVGPRRSLDRES